MQRPWSTINHYCFLQKVITLESIPVPGILFMYKYLLLRADSTIYYTRSLILDTHTTVYEDV